MKTQLDPRIEKLVRKIMRKIKGWSVKDERDDRRDHPGHHEFERSWLRRELLKVKKMGARE